jgi:hypothetical protein
LRTVIDSLHVDIRDTAADPPLTCGEKALTQLDKTNKRRIGWAGRAEIGDLCYDT